jgi:hypothetical protein
MGISRMLRNSGHETALEDATQLRLSSGGVLGMEKMPVLARHFRHGALGSAVLFRYDCLVMVCTQSWRMAIKVLGFLLVWI